MTYVGNSNKDEETALKHDSGDINLLLLND